MDFSLPNDWTTYKDELFLVTIQEGIEKILQPVWYRWSKDPFIQCLSFILLVISIIISILTGFTGKHGQLEMETITWLISRKVSVMLISFNDWHSMTLSSLLLPCTLPMVPRNHLTTSLKRYLLMITHWTAKFDPESPNQRSVGTLPTDLSDEEIMFENPSERPDRAGIGFLRVPISSWESQGFPILIYENRLQIGYTWSKLFNLSMIRSRLVLWSFELTQF